jgi:hypothetical protein
MLTNQVEQNKTEFTIAEKWLVGIAISFGILGLLVFITSIFYFQNAEVFDKTKAINSNKFGDFGSFMSGSVGTIWALVSVILFYLTLRLQRKELSFQRDELELTRNELFGQKNQMIKQNETLSHQQFENTFFQLLTLFNSIVNSLDIRTRDTKVVTNSGRDCFEVFYKKLKNLQIGKNSYKNSYIVSDCEVEETIEAYDDLYNSHKSDMSHYFRTIYHIFKFIDSAKIENKNQYIAITRAQLSSYEQILIFYNCLHINGLEKFKPLIEKYGIFKNLDRNLLLNNEHLNKYKEGAYGK